MMGIEGYGLMGGFGGGFGMLRDVLFWLALVGLVVWGAGRLFDARAAGSRDTPLEILRRRYARGEISQDEHEQAKQAVA